MALAVSELTTNENVPVKVFPSRLSEWRDTVIVASGSPSTVAGTVAVATGFPRSVRSTPAAAADCSEVVSPLGAVEAPPPALSEEAGEAELSNVALSSPVHALRASAAVMATMVARLMLFFMVSLSVGFLPSPDESCPPGEKLRLW